MTTKLSQLGSGVHTRTRARTHAHTCTHANADRLLLPAAHCS